MDSRVWEHVARVFTEGSGVLSSWSAAKDLGGGPPAFACGQPEGLPAVSLGSKRQRRPQVEKASGPHPEGVPVLAGGTGWHPSRVRGNSVRFLGSPLRFDPRLTAFTAPR